MTHLFHNMPTLDNAEIREIEKVIASGWVAQGEKVRQFEDAICAYIGLPPSHGVALSSGTASLYLALKISDFSTSDEVITPTYVCSAVLNAIYMAGAKPVLADIDKTDFNISCQDIAAKISSKTKAIILPHIFGVPADVVQIKRFGISIIEDCAVALGSKIGNNHVGIFGDVGVFSFYASKVITTGQGGMLVSNNPQYVEKARNYREFDCQKVYYPRFNFQMTDIQAAMGLQQVKKLDMFLSKRKQIAESYGDVCSEKGWDFQKPKNNHCFQNWYRFVLKLDSKTVKRLKSHLKKQGIETIVPLEEWELLHNYLKLEAKFFKNAEEIARNTLSLPIYPTLIGDNRFEKMLKSLEAF